MGHTSIQIVFFAYYVKYFEYKINFFVSFKIRVWVKFF